ncbi:ATP-binding cassette sub-family C member 4 isoform X1 [Hyalella azteca]|uniref:ATP-binding cassette sub-family C member 4 isoform X1 n=1 Tax=Hyalella azteca TaxID=294128 RepID=A0A8B7NKR8_HYAAZ|nr:ATP-binding cassette sub-family C member 4 isoform X1 [Hyalella azteca]
MAGLVVIVLFIPLQSFMGKIFSRLRLQTAQRTDERVRVMNEIVNAMRVIKMYAWELPFAEMVKKFRKSEIDVIMHTNYYRAVNMSLFFTSAKLVVFLALLTYVVTGNALTAEKVFVTSALVNNVRLVMTLFFPMAISMGSETLISCRRLQEFFELEEIGSGLKVEHVEDIGPNESASVQVENLSAKWTEEATVLTLESISVSVQAGELLAVVGPVGSGKGSLLHAILGELPALEGTVAVKGKIAYASQEPWLFSGSVRQNILFGREYDEKKYGEVIKVCGLEADLQLLSEGDRTLVGERGTSLSGGQKARINLARAVYMSGDVVLLDDPLSAVDTVVGRHLFRRCIRGHLRQKAVILVTHQLQYIRAADNILVLNEGQCEAFGTYHQLVNKGLDFTSLLQEEKDDASNAGSICLPPHISNKNLHNALRRGSNLSRQGSIRSIGSSSLRKKGDNPMMYDSALSIAGSVTSLDYTHDAMDDTTETLEENWRKSSSKNKQADDVKPENKKYTELRSTGSVSGKIYLKYFLNGGHWMVCLALALASVATQVLYSTTDYWLSYWTNGEQLRRTTSALNSTHDSALDFPLNTTINFALNSTLNSTQSPPEPTLPSGYLDTKTNIIVYTSLVGSLFLLSLGRTILFFVICMTSSKRLHNKMFSAVIRVPIQYFDTHPIGQILNRFSKDLGQVDELLPSTLYDFLCISLNIVGIITVIASVNPYLLIPTFILAGIFWYIRRFYLGSARDIKRLEGITRSPVFSHLSTSLHGLTTIRAFKAQESFAKDFDDIQDVHSAAWFLFICTTRWFGIYLDCLSCLYIAIVTYSFLGNSHSLGGDVGLAISSAMSLSGMFQWGVRQSAEVENQMTSVERVLEFSKLEPEAPLTTEEDKKLDPQWPRSGSIEFIDVSLKYDEAKPPVLKKLNFAVSSGEKIGIVGRTGAGKSSLISCLFRLTEPTGQIIIDGADVSKLGLHTLRKNISIIPQDPTLFNDTFRKNLDPFSQHSDEELWLALEEVQLKEAVQETPGGLEHVVSEGGSNLSVGQRQLVCLARAIISHNPILLMDEATANVDPKTDELIQTTIRDKFRSCTVLTVAHRLHTIMDSTRVMVLSAGQLKEFDAPHLLLKDKKSVFSELVSQAGTSTASHLRNLALTAFSMASADDGKRSSSSSTSPTGRSPVSVASDLSPVSLITAKDVDMTHIKTTSERGSDKDSEAIAPSSPRIDPEVASASHGSIDELTKL